MTQPKEIWVTRHDAKGLIANIEVPVYDTPPATANVPIKYLSEEHFNSLIEEKDKEILRLKAFVIDIYRGNNSIFEEVDLPTPDLYKIRRSLNISKEF